MATVTLQLDGMAETLRALKRVPDVVQKHASQVIGRNAIKVATKARQTVPVASGTLRSAIEWEHRDSSLFGSVGINHNSPARRYWFHVEFGTVNAPAQPFLRPAAESTQSGFIQDMREIGPDVEQEMEQ